MKKPKDAEHVSALRRTYEFLEKFEQTEWFLNENLYQTELDNYLAKYLQRYDELSEYIKDYDPKDFLS